MKYAFAYLLFLIIDTYDSDFIIYLIWVSHHHYIMIVISITAGQICITG